MAAIALGGEASSWGQIALYKKSNSKLLDEIITVCEIPDRPNGIQWVTGCKRSIFVLLPGASTWEVSGLPL